MTIEHEELIEVLKGARTVDMTTPVLKLQEKYNMVKQDAKTSKIAKEYLEQVEHQYRVALEYLYMAADKAYPEDNIKIAHAMSSLGPDDILLKYEFKVIVSRKEQ